MEAHQMYLGKQLTRITDGNVCIASNIALVDVARRVHAYMSLLRHGLSQRVEKDNETVLLGKPVFYRIIENTKQNEHSLRPRQVLSSVALGS